LLKIVRMARRPRPHRLFIKGDAEWAKLHRMGCC
jgi:hypothetical protein